MRSLRTFCAAARYESFTAAGEALHITPSAVSHQIKSLEDELGHRLFERSGPNLELTAVGKSLFGEINPLIERLDTITASYRSEGSRGSIRISVQPFFASEYFIPRLGEFTAAHPRLDIKVGTSDESSDRHPTDADLSIRLFSSPPTEQPSDLLFPLRLAPAGSAEFARGVTVRKKAIVSDFPVIVHETQPQAWERWTQVCGIRLPAEAKVLRFDSMIAAARAAERGVGAALVPVPLADSWFDAGRLVRLFEQELCTDVSYYLVCKHSVKSDPGVAALRDWILQTFAEG